MKRDQRGFTLMELMIVIVIIGVLAAIGVPAYKNYVTKAKTAACESNRRTIATALGMYYAEEGEYPISLGDSKLAEYVSNIAEISKCPANKDISYELEVSGDEVSGWNVAITCGEEGHEPFIVSGTYGTDVTSAP
ncbi:MAG: type IV pilin protein [Bacillota bacterium]|jgi:type II secretion system protein G